MRKIFSESLILFACFLFFFPVSSFSQDWKKDSQQMLYYFRAGNNKKAIEFGQKALELLKGTDTTKTDYAAVLNNLSYVYLVDQQYTKAQNGFLEVLEIIHPVLGNEHKITIRTNCYLGKTYMFLGNYQKAESLFKQALVLRKKNLSNTDPLVIYSYSLLKLLNENKNNFIIALHYQDTIIDLTKQKDGEFQSSHLLELSNKANIYDKATQFNKAIELMESVVMRQTKKDELAKETFNYLYRLGLLYQKVGDYKKAIPNYDLIAKNKKRKFGESNDYAKSLSTLGVILNEAGQLQKAKKTYDKAIDILKVNNAENTADYAQVINNLAVLHYSLGEFFVAEQYYLQAKDLREATIGVNHLNYVFTLNGLAVLYQESGNFEKAKPLYLEGLEILKKHKKKTRLNFALLTNLGELYEKINEYSNAESIYKEAYQLGQKIYGDNSADFAKLLKKLAGVYKNAKKYKLADSLYTECITILEKSVGKNHFEYASVLNNRSGLYIYTHNYEKAEKDLLESAAIKKSLFGEFHYEYSVSQNNLAALYHAIGEKKKCEKYLVRANENIINKVNESLSYMTGQESEAFLKSTDYLFDIYYSYYFMEKKNNPKLSSFAYDNVLARKGLMLQSEKNLRKSVFKTGDSAIIKNYLELIKIKEKQAKAYTAIKVKNDDENKLLNQRAEQIEKELATNSIIFNVRSQLKVTGWKDIKKNLQKNEVAIEFIRFNFYDLKYTDKVYYCALILKSDYKYPKMQFLFEEKELSGYLNKEMYYSDEQFIAHLHHKRARKEDGYKPEDDKISEKLDSLIWRPIEPHLKEVKTVFYSPGGMLHNISFAALSVNDSTYVSDKYELNALISTRSIIDHERYIADTDFKVNLYGGIDYDVDPKTISSLTRAYRKDTTLQKDNNNVKLLTNTVTRGTNWSFLHGTLKETEAIEKLFKEKKINVTTYKGESAIEETFKQYTGDVVSPNIIHIATHGFFIADPEDKKPSNVSGIEYNAFEVAKNPLFRSGLLFAGANRSWNNKEMPENSEDGILTAYEVSNTNLTNTDLVVLSACETGLGEIKGSEGVYGLQRSFKIAGAKYLIMSLWQIPDYQTMELMKSFYTYKNLNFTIPEAFNLAQNEMKKKYLPYYWAAFVLLK